eukprot:1159081-Pelagomonas_calceolata.AAC.15
MREVCLIRAAYGADTLGDPAPSVSGAQGLATAAYGADTLGSPAPSVSGAQGLATLFWYAFQCFSAGGVSQTGSLWGGHFGKPSTISECCQRRWDHPASVLLVELLVH